MPSDIHPRLTEAAPMPELFKPDRPFPLPADAEVIDRDGRPHVRVRGRGGRAELFPLSKDGTKYLKPAAKWAADIRTADGRRKRVRLSANRAAAEVMLAELLKRIENEKAGIFDRTAGHRKRPLAAHLDDWQRSLEAAGRSAEYVGMKLGRTRAAFDGCGFVMPADLSADRLETFLHDLRETEKRSIQTANDWLQACRQFARWMVANDRLDRDPFARLKGGNARLDPKRRRGEFGPEELTQLLRAAAASRDTFRGLTGADRAMLYRAAAGTGFRAKELSALVPDLFDLDARPPTVLLPAGDSKNRKGAVQPLPAALAAELRGYLAGRPGKEPVWPGTWAERAAEMLRADLAAAGVLERVDGPEGEEVRDFHSLRNKYISDLIRTGADLKQVMTLARHTDPRLTANRYARTRLYDLGAVVDGIESGDSGRPRSEPAVLRLTGTDGAGAGAAPGAAACDNRRVRLRTVEETDDNRDTRPADVKRLGMKASEGGGGELRADEEGAASGIRTLDPSFTKAVLYR